MQSVTLSLYRFGSVPARAWALFQMGPARFALRAIRDIGTVKLCGSGVGEGFTPVPDTSVYAILATWPDHDSARRAMFGTRVFRRYAEMADETLTIFLTPTSARGRWDGAQPFTPQDAASDGPVAALTRATVKLRSAGRFWRQEPEISRAIGQDPNVLFKIGIGELPLVRQATFSIWPDTRSMAAFARADGPHARAIRAVREGHLFKEDLYARFRVDALEGTWAGETPDLTRAPQTVTDQMKVAAE
ncbi:spheroidene monooxygenase [Roseicyclus persicicus]|uniref:Spheroidene monooxygenase n=1 Tax=Roseicyclus persicicus TaxID=2650661 RepID=A0A7X6JZ06_9RHOB|nr:spheroidene monooxygenase [Roseibacterium persicicum]NKX45044.1 spheroidene monooxygenase [Roseibacterium persicicum]